MIHKSIRVVAIIGLFIITSSSGFSQPLGLWEVEQVSVGEQIMTPVAKWTRINADGSFESGNGWLKHTVGLYELDNTKTHISFNATNGTEDLNEPFAYTMAGDKMFWSRTEEDMTVNVTLKKIDELPSGPADKIKGLWQLESVKGDASTSALNWATEQNIKLFIRWDRVLTHFEGGKRTYGFWNVHGHRSELTMIYSDKSLPNEVWKIEVESERLTLTQDQGDKEDVVLAFSRTHSFN